MGVIDTIAALGACLLVLVGAVALDRRPYRPGKRNYVPIMHYHIKLRRCRPRTKLAASATIKSLFDWPPTHRLPCIATTLE